LRKFDFGVYNTVIAHYFGEATVLDPGSGIEALFPPRPVGRPKKQKLQAKKDNKSPETSLVDILAQATDIETKETFLLVHWANEDISWTPVRLLSIFTHDWWLSESERRFPYIDLTKEAPALRITGGPVTVIFDD
jgi:hypothetical protein